MPRERTFLLVLATLILAGVAVGRLDVVERNHRNVQPAWRVEPRTQSKQERAWQERSFVKTMALGPATLAEPLSLKEDPSGDLLVLDWFAACVRRFSADGRPRASYRLPPGAAGGHPDDFDVDASGNVWICYHDAGTVAEIEPGGRLLQTWHLANHPHRVLAAQSGRLVVFAGDSGRYLFDRVSAQGRTAGGFGQLLAGDSQGLLALDGDVARDGAGGFVYAAAHAGLLASFTLSGEPRFLVRTIDPVELPKLVQAPGKPTKVAPGSRLAALTVSVAGDLIYVLADLPALQGGPGRALDVYSNLDGGYLYSFRAPEQTPFALVAGDRVYTIHDDLVTRWQMRD